jgi:fructoselysine-6-phosphate deglycase
MLNFDRDRFVKIQRGAVDIADWVHPRLGDLLADGVERVYFMGTGGAQLLMLPAAGLLQRRSSMPVQVRYPAEVVLDEAVELDEKSLVIIPSLSGTTKESVEVLQYLKGRKARTLSLTGHADTPLAQDADLNYSTFAEDDTSSETFYLQSLLIALSLMAHRGEFPDHERVVSALRSLPELLVGAKETFEPRAAALAEEIKDEDYHIFTGAGSAWPEAHYFGMCILEEMQWIRTRPVHAADFFHGTLELVEPGVSVFLLKGEDHTRPLAARVENFTPRYTDRLRVLDTRDVALPGIPDDVRALISPVVLATLLERLSTHLSVLRDHPLTTRRYYKRVEY